MKKNILIVHHGVGNGGALVALLGLLDLLKADYNLRVLSLFKGSHECMIERKGVEVIRPKSIFYRKVYRVFVHSEAAYSDLIARIRKLWALLLYFLSLLFFAKIELKSLIKEDEIVYLNTLFLSDFAYAANLLNKKVICHMREPISAGGFGIRKGFIQRILKKSVSKIISVSYDNTRRLHLPELTTTIYDPVVSRNEGVPIHTNDGLIYFAYPGGAQRIKGFESICDSLDHLNENIRIYFMGPLDGYSTNRLKNLIRRIFDPYIKVHEMNLKKIRESKKIILLGMIENPLPYYAVSTAIICPFSKPHAALPILESFSIGKPVIVSDVDGMDELVDVDNGAFFSNGSGTELANAMNYLSKANSQELDHKCTAAQIKYSEVVASNKSVSEVVETVFVTN